MVATIFGGLAATENIRDRKLTAHRVLAINAKDVIANPSYRPWSEVPITFSKADQWADIPYIGCFPLVLDAACNTPVLRSYLAPRFRLKSNF